MCPSFRFLRSNTKTNKTSDAIELAKNDFQLHLRWTKWNVGNACNGEEYDQGRLKKKTSNFKIDPNLLATHFLHLIYVRIS